MAHHGDSVINNDTRKIKKGSSILELIETAGFSAADEEQIRFARIAGSAAFNVFRLG